MKEISVRANVEFTWYVDDDVEVDNAFVDSLIGYEHEGEVIAEVQNNADWSVENE